MSLTRVSYGITNAPLNVLAFGATGNGYTDDSAAIQSAVNAAISGTGELFFPAGNYLINSTIEVGSTSSIPGGIKIYGTTAQSTGNVSSLIQGNINNPIFQIDSISTQLEGLSFTCWAGSAYNSSGTRITAISYTTNSITLSGDPWLGLSPVIWTVASPLIATDGTSYTTVLQFSLQGSWYGSSVTKNSDGTVTINNVKGANGTLNSSISGVVGNGVNFVSLANSISTSLLTNANAGIIYCDIKENQFYNNLWFNQVPRCFNFSALGSGGGVGVGTGNAGFFHDIVIDGAINFIYAQGSINGAQIVNSQFYGTSKVFYCPYGSLENTTISNCQLIISNLIQANSNISSCVINGNNFNAASGFGYSDYLINIGGTIYESIITNNNFGRNSTGACINADGLKSTVFANNNILSNGETTTDPWMYLNATCSYSLLENNNFAEEYTSTSNRLGFQTSSPTITNTKFGYEFIGYVTTATNIGWITPTLTNSWSNVGSGFYSASYYKDLNGRVYLKGVVTGGSGSIFTLGSGYIPSGEIRIPVANSGNINVLTIGTDGTIGAGSGNSWVDLNNISFTL